jgi:hypothetical protein
MTSKTYTQFGTFSAVLMLPILIFLVIMLILTGFNDPLPAIILIFVIVILVICLLIFYKLTIDIDDTHVAFSFGIGLVKKKYPLKDIAGCRPVKNNFLYGIGIRLTPDGWLYNVSGLYAIELTFTNKKSKVRIGTDKPEELSETINKLLNKPDSGSAYDAAFDSSNRSGYYILASIILLGLALPIVLIISGGKDTKLEYSDPSFTIKGMYGMTIDYSKIIRIDTISSLPKIKSRTNGYAFGNTLKGNFKLFDQTKVKLFIEEGIPPYIFIKTDGTDLYLNFKDTSTTIELYKKITTTINLIR